MRGSTCTKMGISTIQIKEPARRGLYGFFIRSRPANPSSPVMGAEMGRALQVPEEEEKKKSVVVECKRIAAPTPSIHDHSNALGKEEKGKDKIKKPRRSQAEAVILEGSRCSRINGRGWQCAQPTLVGYSLCEHHLGKGRLRGPSIAPKGPLGCTEHRKKESGEGSLHHEIALRRRSKARSISSLLDGQTNRDNQLIGSAMKNIGEGV